MISVSALNCYSRQVEHGCVAWIESDWKVM
jgi:hypothetical protein